MHFSCGSQPNLNGYYFLGKQDLPRFAGPGLSWKPVPGPGGPAVKTVIMKVRPLGYIGGSRDANGRGGEPPIEFAVLKQPFKSRIVRAKRRLVKFPSKQQQEKESQQSTTQSGAQTSERNPGD